MSGIAQTPQPPYYAVIFTSERTDGDHGYAEMAEEMVKLASRVAEKTAKLQHSLGAITPFQEFLQNCRNGIR